MSIKSQESNMRHLAVLLGQDLGYICGKRECGPNGVKKNFLNLGKVFLRALAKDLGLRNIKVISNPGGIAVSGECYLYGMWQSTGLFMCINQSVCGRQDVILYRSIRDLDDHKGGHNHYIRLNELQSLTYEQMLDRLSKLNKEGFSYERAA